MTSTAASEQAFQTLMQMQIMQECPEGLARAHLCLSIWPNATREQVLIAARDDNFGKELPVEIILANRQEISGIPPPDLHSPPSPPGGRKRPRPARINKMKPIGGVPGDSSALTVGASPPTVMPSAYLTPPESFAMTKPPEAKPEGTRRAPQICQKCHQPRKGHTCSALNGNGANNIHQSGLTSSVGSGSSIASGKTTHMSPPSIADFPPVSPSVVGLDYPQHHHHLSQHLMSIPSESFTHPFITPEYLSFDPTLSYSTDPLAAQLALDPSKRLRSD